ncbi:MAG: helix-turn-helix domain-containing protein [Streptosporangiaceae bacterium]
MRNFAVTVMRRAGFSGNRVAEVFGLSAAYLSTLHAAAAQEGSAALVKHAGPGRPPELGAQDRERARAWRVAGVSDREIGRRLGVAGTTVGRQLGPRDHQGGEPQAPSSP